MAYTYDDFLKEANSAGLLNQFSSYDLETAKRSPEFGISLLSYKKDYSSATNAESKALANAGAEALRKRYGYSAGADGSKYYADNPYTVKKQELLSALTNTKSFSYDAESDPLYRQYRKQYIREGKRAGAHALGEAAALTGGRASSYAVTAASQAENSYAAKLTDKIPELEEAAYQRYQKEYQRLMSELETVNAADQQFYDRQRDALSDQRYDEETAYQKERDALSDQRYDEETAYQKERDALSDQRYDEETAYQKERDSVSDQRYADETAYSRERDAISDQRYADETAYQKYRDSVSDSRYAAELAMKQTAQEKEWELEQQKLSQERELAMYRLANTAWTQGGLLNYDKLNELKEYLGGSDLSHQEWNVLLAANPALTEEMLLAAGFTKDGSGSSAALGKDRISTEEAKKLEQLYGGKNLSETQWNRILSENPEYTSNMLKEAGFVKNSAYKVEASSSAYDTARKSAENLAAEGYSKQYILDRLWTLWRVGSITDSEWREFQRIYS